MISKNQIKYIHSLALKKNRDKEGCFVGEGPKVVADLLAVQTPEILVATDKWYASTNITPRQQDAVVTEEELGKVSFLQHPQQVLGCFVNLMKKFLLIYVTRICVLRLIKYKTLAISEQ